MRFDPIDLRLFVAVVDAGSITHGASRVNLAAASASGRIKQMEEAVGVPLLHRTRSGVRPTDAGHTLLRHARTMTTAMHRLTEDLDQFANGLRGTIRLLANTNALSEFLPAPVSHFLASHPNVNIQLEEKLSHEIVDALMEGTADMGILAASADIGMLQSYPFASDRLCAVVPAAQKDFSGLTSIDFLSLLRHPFVSNASGAAIQMYLEAQAQNLHARIHSRIHLGSFEAICRFVENGVGVSVVPESAARRYRRTMAIQMLDLTDDWAVREMRVCVASRDGMATYAIQLLDHLVASSTAREIT